jgi:hypothetical protein
VALLLKLGEMNWLSVAQHPGVHHHCMLQQPAIRAKTFSRFAKYEALNTYHSPVTQHPGVLQQCLLRQLAIRAKKISNCGEFKALNT